MKQSAIDVIYVKKLLPDHYQVSETNDESAIHCKSAIGLRMDKDADDEEHFEYIFKALKQHFGDRFQEVYHKTCAYHQDFFIYLKPLTHIPLDL